MAGTGQDAAGASGGPDRARPGSRRRRRSVRRLNLLLAVTGGFVLAGIIGAVAWNWTSVVPIDQVSFCPEPGPTAIHAILVDRSDPLGAGQRQRVREALERAIAEAPVGSRVSLYVADSEDVEVLNPRVTLCNPGTLSSRLYPYPAAQRERYDQAFRAGIDEVVQALAAKPDRSLSPVMEAVRAVCLDAFRNMPSGGPLRMTLIGEMAQYSRQANHYSDRNFDAMLTPARLEPVLADCKGAETDILYMQRPTPTFLPGPQGLAHRRFWEMFLQRMKARPRNTEVVPFATS